MNEFNIDMIESGYFKGKENLNIYYEKIVNPRAKAIIVVVHGYSESVEKYEKLKEIIYNHGFSVYLIENRGHGRSGRLGKDSSQINVEKFQYYIDDLTTFMDEVVIPEREGLKLFILGHSLGGAISAMFLEKEPSYFDLAVLNAPMLQINTGKIPMFLAKIIANLECAFGGKLRYVIGNGPFTTVPDVDGSSTSDKKRYSKYFTKQLNRKELQTGGPSYYWFRECFRASEYIIKKENASKVTIPVLLIQPGKDNFVKPKGQNKFAERAKDCKIVKMPGSKHEPFMETDEIVNRWKDLVFDFINKSMNK